jgi:hypothetical protein
MLRPAKRLQPRELPVIGRLVAQSPPQIPRAVPDRADDDGSLKRLHYRHRETFGPSPTVVVAVQNDAAAC